MGLLVDSCVAFDPLWSLLYGGVNGKFWAKEKKCYTDTHMVFAKQKNVLKSNL